MMKSLTGKAVVLLAAVLMIAGSGCMTAGAGCTGMRNVRDFGAKGDGIARDTAAVQAALDAGGIVHVPAGTYLCGTLYLRSNGGLNLAPGAVILGSPDPADYCAADAFPQNRASKGDNTSGGHLIVAVNQHHVSITGQGRIDGNRKAFYDVPIRKKNIRWRPAQMIYFCECDDVKITDVEMYNAPYWTCLMHGCGNLQIRGVKILNDYHTPNGDGLDIDCCRMVTVSGCLIDCGDDCITLRGAEKRLLKPRPCEMVTVTNCVLRTSCNAIRVGVGTGTVRNCSVSNCIIHGSRNAITVCSKYSPHAGTLIEDISFDNIRIDSEKAVLLLINTGYGSGPAIRPIRRIHFSGLRGICSKGSVLKAENPGEISDITFSDCALHFRYDPEKSAGTLNSKPENTGYAPEQPLYAEKIDNLRLFNCRWSYEDPVNNWKQGFKSVQCRNVVCSSCNLEKQ